MNALPVIGWIGCFAAGWLWPSHAPAAQHVATVAPVPAARTTPAAMPATFAAPGAALAAKPVVYPHIVLTDEESELLHMTPEQAVAKGDSMGASAQHIARCHELLPDPPALCEQLDVTMHHLRLAETANLQAFLSGTLEAAAFQEQHHRNMLAWQLELEGELSYDQMMRYPGMEPGDDPFLVVTAWGIALPPGYTLGEDILMRQPGEGDAASAPENPRNPWTYGKKVAEGGAP
jgi:hypothetical protein